MQISFIQKIRDNAFFDNLQELKMQISTDIDRAKTLLKPE
ncbi:riboflavin kinase [Helicobacter felistomachi]|nr:riboflavin kinase [Helicobacter sp. NHP21005]